MSQIQNKYEVLSGINTHVLTNFFEDGLGDWAYWNSAFYNYTGSGYWKSIPDDEVLTKVTNFTHDCYAIVEDKKTKRQFKSYIFRKPGIVKEAVEYAGLKLNQPQPEEEEKRYICFKNGTFNTQTKTLVAHDKKHLLTYRIEFDHAQTQTCPPVYQEFFLSSYGEEQIQLIRAIGWGVLSPKRPTGWFAAVMGESRSGKGVLLRALGSLINPEAVNFNPNVVSSLGSPEKIFQQLKGKSLVIAEDVAGRFKEDSLGVFYSLVDHTPINGRKLFKDGNPRIDFKGVFLMGFVHHPSVPRQSGGWETRVKYLHTKPRLANLDPTLETRLKAARGEFASWLLAMDETEAIYTLKGKKDSEEVRLIKQDAAIAGSSALAFVNNCVTTIDNPNYKTGIESVYPIYQAYARDRGYTPMNQQNFFLELSNHFPKHFRRMGRRIPNTDKFAHDNVMRGAWVIPACYQVSNDKPITFNPNWFINNGIDILHGLIDKEDLLTNYAEGELEAEFKEVVIGAQADPFSDSPDKLPILEEELIAEPPHQDELPIIGEDAEVFSSVVYEAIKVAAEAKYVLTSQANMDKLKGYLVTIGNLDPYLAKYFTNCKDAKEMIDNVRLMLDKIDDMKQKGELVLSK